MDFKEIARETERTEYLKSAWNCEWLSLKRQLHGKSGDRIQLVDVNFEGFDGQGILKFSDKDLTKEADRQEQALSLNTQFGSLHFPKVVKRHNLDGWSALLMTVAGNGLLFTDSFSTITDSRFRLLAAQNLASKLLTDWNIHAKVSDTQFTPTQLLRRWLGHRIETQSRLSDLIERN